MERLAAAGHRALYHALQQHNETGNDPYFIQLQVYKASFKAKIDIKKILKYDFVFKVNLNEMRQT